MRHHPRWSFSSAGRLLHRLPSLGLACDQRLSLVQRLGGDFARVVDPHQARRVAALTVVQHIVRDIGGGTLRSGAEIHLRCSAKDLVERDDEAVQSVDVAIGTFRHRLHLKDALHQSTVRLPKIGVDLPLQPAASPAR